MPIAMQFPARRTFPIQPEFGASSTLVLAGRNDAPEPPAFGRLPREVIWNDEGTARLADALILMVDDELLNAEMTGVFLAEAGYRRFLHTDRPEQALALMRQHAPALVLLDLSMPKVSGVEILAAMREDPHLRHLPVIVMTGSTEASVKLQALAVGAMDFLLKPVDPSELTLRIRNALAASAYRDYLAQHDPLTALPNKLRYRAAAQEVVAQAAANGTTGALLHVGIDGLGRINDALGRTVGDQLLQRVARRLASCVQTEADGELSSGRHNPTLYRYDGDEFAVLVPHLDGVPSAAAFITKLLEEGTVHFRRQGAPEVFVTCSIGVSVFPNDGTDVDVLMRNAGLALHHAKQARVEHYEFFSPHFNEQALRRLDLGAELRRALARDQIDLCFEPRIELASGRLSAAQALLRWKHPSGRIIEGDELMDLAGTSGMDVALTEWLFDQLRRQTREWKAGGLLPVPIGIKAPLAHIQPRDLAHLVNASLLAGVDPALLCIELQQVAGLDDREAAVFAALRAKGVRFALDRFGSTAQVAHLRRLMVDELKIDASFTRELGRDEGVQAMLLGMGDLAQRLRLTCVACGVDDAKQLAFLRKHDWPQVQGRYLGDPLTGAQFSTQWLERRLSR
jgi:diguanylate cyclase (GGDEF)-like protein